MATPTLTGVLLKPAPVVVAVIILTGGVWNLPLGVWYFRLAVTDNTVAGSAGLGAWSAEGTFTLAAGQAPFIQYNGDADFAGGGVVCWLSQTQGDAHSGASMAVLQTTLLPLSVAATSGLGGVVIAFSVAITLINPWFPPVDRAAGIASGDLLIAGGTEPDPITWEDVTDELVVLGLGSYVTRDTDPSRRRGPLMFNGEVKVIGWFQMWDEVIVARPFLVDVGAKTFKCGEKTVDGSRRKGGTVVQLVPSDFVGSNQWKGEMAIYDTNIMDGFEWIDPGWPGGVWDRAHESKASESLVLETKETSTLEAVKFQGISLVDFQEAGTIPNLTLKDIRTVTCPRTSLQSDATNILIEDGAYEGALIPDFPPEDGHLEVTDLRVVSRDGDYDLNLVAILTGAPGPDDHMGHQFTDATFEETGDDNDPRIRLIDTFNTQLNSPRIASLRIAKTVNLLLLFSSGLPVSGATVEVSRDLDGVVLFSVTTGGNGRIAQQKVIRKQYIAGWDIATWAANGNQVTGSITELLALGTLVETGNTPMTMRIRFTGWETQVIPITLEKPMQETLVLLPTRSDRMVVREEGEVVVLREEDEVEVNVDVQERVVLVDREEVIVE